MKDQNNQDILKEEAIALVYIAGPLFTKAERLFLEKLTEVCEKLGAKTYLPHRDAGLRASNASNLDQIFESDRKYLDMADFLVAVLHGADVDSGTAWEMGYAFSRGKKILRFCEDRRVGDPMTNLNPMVIKSCLEVVSSLKALEKTLSVLLES